MRAGTVLLSIAVLLVVAVSVRGEDLSFLTNKRSSLDIEKVTPIVSKNDEKVKRTKIIAYKKSEFSEAEVKEEMERIKEDCRCDVQNLPHVGVFVLTYQSSIQKASSRMSLIETKEVEEDDVTVGLLNHIDIRRAPSDPVFRKHQWALHNLPNNADINMAAGWDEFLYGKSCGDPRYDVIVAVIDSGIDYNHPELNPMMWRNPNEIPGNGLDDDENGLIDDVYGADYTLDPPTGDPMERDPTWNGYGHGTFIAGIIAAKEENGQGVAGVASYAEGKIKLMALKGVSAETGAISGLLKSLEYAIANNATISSNSWGTIYNSGHSYNLTENMERIWKTVLQNNPDHLFITSAGNDNVEINDNYRPITCGIQEPNFLCVASSNIQNQKSWFSNYGEDYVHVFAPGSQIPSTFPNNGYEFSSGTSMACPHVSGLAALVRAMRNDFSGKDVKDLIESNVVQKPVYSGLVSSGGIIDAEKTLKAARISETCVERYFLAGHGNLCSALNGNVINDASECSDAANLIGKIFGREASWRDAPGGCFLFTPTNSNSPIKPYGLYVYYNNFDHEVISPSANLLCKKTTVNGGWGTWSSWTNCNARCPRTRGKQRRIRKCNNPKPENGGETCVGEEKERKNCRITCSSWNKCARSDDCDDTEFCWNGYCRDTRDSSVCATWECIPTVDRWEWKDLYTDSNFKCTNRPACNGKKCWNRRSKSQCRKILLKGSCAKPFWKKACCVTCRAGCGNLWSNKRCQKLVPFCRRSNTIRKKCRKSCRRC